MISNTDDIIDSRDVIARINELEGERDSYEIAAHDKDGNQLDEMVSDTDESKAAWIEENTDEADELKSLLALQEDADGYCSEWKDGAPLIHDDHFQTYAKELAEDIGAIDRNADWPLNHIDWKEAAEDLKQDYSPVNFDGQEYWVRS